MSCVSNEAAYNRDDTASGRVHEQPVLRAKVGDLVTHLVETFRQAAFPAMCSPPLAVQHIAIQNAHRNSGGTHEVLACEGQYSGDTFHVFSSFQGPRPSNYQMAWCCSIRSSHFRVECPHLCFQAPRHALHVAFQEFAADRVCTASSRSLIPSFSSSNKKTFLYRASAHRAINPQAALSSKLYTFGLPFYKASAGVVPFWGYPRYEFQALERKEVQLRVVPGLTFRGYLSGP